MPSSVQISDARSAIATPSAAATASSPPSARNYTIDSLRGIAALAVCWFHYTNAQFTEHFGLYKSTGAYGYLGVQIFFVVSGFVIPMTMLRSGYRLRHYATFLYKRALRIHPPYLASIAVCIAGLAASAVLQEHAYQFSGSTLLINCFYLSDLLHRPWIQMTYWSLAIEFQYYVCIGLLLPLAASSHRRVWYPTLLALAGLAVLLRYQKPYLPASMPMFLAGIAVFRFMYVTKENRELILDLTASVLVGCWVNGPLAASVCLGTALALLLLKVRNPILNFLGAISYSLYLLHVFVGNAVFGIGVKYVDRFHVLAVVLPFVCLAIALTGAWLFYLLVERPCSDWSSRVKFRKLA